MKVCIGGTFDKLHKGHKFLINTAFQIAGTKGSVFIGITSGKITKIKGNVKPFKDRKKIIEQYLTKKGYINRAKIKSIINKYGPSVKEKFDAIVVSPETKENAEENIEQMCRKLLANPIKDNYSFEIEEEK